MTYVYAVCGATGRWCAMSAKQAAAAAIERHAPHTYWGQEQRAVEFYHVSGGK